MTGGGRLCLGLAWLAAGCSSGDAATSARTLAAGASGLCVTSGAIERGGRVAAPSVRAVLLSSRGDEATLSFVYAGPTADSKALASGQHRRQVGLKLRAADGCNLVYAMWRFGPDAPRIEVSVKHNPGERTHAECGNGGYRKIKGEAVEPVAAPAPGQAYALSARLAGQRLEVRLDDRVVWAGDLGADAAALTGPVGLRTDNVALERVALGAPLGGAPAARGLRCASIVLGAGR